jgi:hypothetical protein
VAPGQADGTRAVSRARNAGKVADMALARSVERVDVTTARPYPSVGVRQFQKYGKIECA